MNKEQDNIFARHNILNGFGVDAQKKILGAKVCVVGCGGLGCGLLPYIIAAGVGSVTMIDSGGVEASNLQRQPLYGVDDIGVEKVEAAYKKLSIINHSTALSPLKAYVTSENIVRAISAEFDMVIDCTDNFAVRYLLADYCWQRQISLISAAVLEYHGHIMSLVNKAENPCLRCLVAEEPVGYKRASDVGVFGPAVGVMGALQAVESVKMLAGVGESLESHFLSVDFLSMRVNKMRRQVNPECKFCLKYRENL